MEGFNLANITDAYVGNTQVSAIYKGSTVVWEPTPTGHDYVDLGLPSGTLWATMNVGASSETDYGNYYMYGKGSTQYNSSDSPYSGTENPLAASADTAAQEWGGDWYMPTKAQFDELKANTTYEWTTIDGVNGGKFTATNGSGNYVFFPAAGRYDDGSPKLVGRCGVYWNSTTENSTTAYYFYLVNGSNGISTDSREKGFTVRPVTDAQQS